MNENTMALMYEEVQGLSDEQRISKLVDCLTDASSARRKLAGDLLVAEGKAKLSILMREAMSRRTRPRQCAEILSIVARIGGPLIVDDWMKLPVLACSRHGAVSQTAAGLIIVLRQANRFPAVPASMAVPAAQPVPTDAPSFAG